MCVRVVCGGDGGGDDMRVCVARMGCVGRGVCWGVWGLPRGVIENDMSDALIRQRHRNQLATRRCRAGVRGGGGGGYGLRRRWLEL